MFVSMVHRGKSFSCLVALHCIIIAAILLHYNMCIHNYRISPFKRPWGALQFAKKTAKRLSILFCQFLLGKKIIWGPEGGVRL